MAYRDFYQNVLNELLTKYIINKTNNILVVCGGLGDKKLLENLGFSCVTISNLDERMKADDFKPYDWDFQDAEDLKYKDEQFDFVIVRAGLHHCRSPHKALCEMYRVAKTGILAFEARDNMFIRLACFLKIAEKHEISAVGGNNLQYGGIRNSSIPNYVYRWTEREVMKTIRSYAPYAKHSFRFFYSLNLPLHGSLLRKKFPLRFFVMVVAPLIKIFTLIFPKQCNQFAVLVMKPNLPQDLQPWLEQTDKGLVVKKHS
ncbi:MAG: class I SAM-dependent methyltransferase [Planctomycetota bacterium]|jgi:ubiquinone/menaquinone biosynthesis C-methylase UbiE